jgi:SAM-dependent methyltransferase
VTWDLGCYESFAPDLQPVAESVVDRLAPRAGEMVLDVGCGTGNATLVAARRGARVTGVDPATRLLEIARAAATAEGLGAQFAEGEAARIPLPDGSVDALVSVFGVVFAPDAGAAAAEFARVLRPDARIVLSAWLWDGALIEQARLRQELFADLVEGPAFAPFAWHDRKALGDLLGPYGFTVLMERQEHVFTAESPQAYADAQLVGHPLWVAARAVLEPAGRWDRARSELTEDPAAFRLTAGYAIATATR